MKHHGLLFLNYNLKCPAAATSIWLGFDVLLFTFAKAFMTLQSHENQLTVHHIHAYCKL